MPANPQAGRCRPDESGRGRPATALHQALDRAQAILDTSPAPLPAELTIHHSDLAIAVRLEANSSADRITVGLEAPLGYLAFTAEDRIARRRALGLIAAANRSGPDCFVIDRGGRVTLHALTLAPISPSRSAVFKLIAIALLCLGPRAERLRALLRPTRSAAMQSKTAA